MAVSSLCVRGRMQHQKSRYPSDSEAEPAKRRYPGIQASKNPIWHRDGTTAPVPTQERRKPNGQDPTLCPVPTVYMAISQGPFSHGALGPIYN